MSDTEEHKISSDTEIKDTGKTVRILLDKDQIKKEIIDDLQREGKVDKALSQFETLKQVVTEKYPAFSDQIASCSSPADVMEIVEVARNEKPTKQHDHAGKAMMTPPSSGEQYADNTQLIDELYRLAYSRDPDIDASTRKNARERIEKLIESMVTGESWRQLKQDGTRKIEQHKITECSQCHATLIDRSDCPRCGYNPFEKQKIVKTKIFSGAVP